MVYLRTYREGSHQNERRTLLNPVNLVGVIARVNSSVVRTELAKNVIQADVHLWDFGARASSHIKSGDVTYILCEDTLYYSKAVAKISDPDGEIGDVVGWHRIQGASWANPVILASLTRLEALASVVALLPKKEQLENNFYRLQA